MNYTRPRLLLPYVAIFSHIFDHRIGRGIGFETAFSLAKQGAKVLFAARNLEKATKELEDMTSMATLPVKPELFKCDLESCQSCFWQKKQGSIFPPGGNNFFGSLWKPWNWPGVMMWEIYSWSFYANVGLYSEILKTKHTSTSKTWKPDKQNSTWSGSLFGGILPTWDSERSLKMGEIRWNTIKSTN